jgi:hypothetical protein
MLKKTPRSWLILLGVLIALVILNPVAVISWLSLPLVSLGILGCPTEHRPRFTVGSSSNGQPIFYFDEFTWNSGDQFFFPLNITNSTAKSSEREAWKIKCLSRPNFRLKSLEYGRVPPGWTEVVPAKEIVPGDFYTINNGDFFTKTNTGHYEHFARDEYFYKAQHHQLYKTP